MKRSMKIVLPVAIIVAGALIMFLLIGMKTDSPKRTPQPRPKVVATETVTLRPIPASIFALGRITSARPIDLYSEVAGVLMEGDVPFKPAQSFKKGDVLVRIDDRQARLALNRTKSDLLNALAAVLPEIKLDFPEEYEVWQEYFNSCNFDVPVGPLPETGNPKIKMFLSRFSVYKLYFSVRDLEITLDKHNFMASFDGSIVSTALRVGASARSGSLLGQIVSLSDLEVEVSVPANDIPWIDYGESVVMYSRDHSEEWTGKVRRIGGSVESRTQTVPVYVGINNGDWSGLFDGAYLEVRIPGSEVAGAISVPRSALYQDRYVYLIRDGKLEYREVTIARQETDRVIVNGGLSEGDTLIVEVMQGVAPGMPAQSRTISAN